MLKFCLDDNLMIGNIILFSIKKEKNIKSLLKQKGEIQIFYYTCETGTLKCFKYKRNESFRHKGA